MIAKRYSHNAAVIVDHLKEDLIYIDGKDELLELAEYVDRLQEENGYLKAQLSDVRKESYGNLDGINYYQEQNCHLSSKISDLKCENEQLKQSYNEFEDECQSTFNIMSRKHNDLCRENFKLKEVNKELKFEIQNLRAVLRNIYGIVKENGVITRLRLVLEFEEHINNKWWKK